VLRTVFVIAMTTVFCASPSRPNTPRPTGNAESLKPGVVHGTASYEVVWL
jgi:hypothetical protein